MAEFDPKNKKHLVSLQGQSYITAVGLQARLVDQGKYIIGIDTEIVEYPTKDNNQRAIVLSTVYIRSNNSKETFKFRSVGDADQTNVSKNLANATIRMAETRSVSRSLRIATRSDFTALDELPPMNDNDERPA